MKIKKNWDILTANYMFQLKIKRPEQSNFFAIVHDGFDEEEIFCYIIVINYKIIKALKLTDKWFNYLEVKVFSNKNPLSAFNEQISVANAIGIKLTDITDNIEFIYE